MCIIYATLLPVIHLYRVVELYVKIPEDQLGLLEHILDCGIIYESDQGPFRISGISAGVIESSIKILEN